MVGTSNGFRRVFPSSNPPTILGTAAMVRVVTLSGEDTFGGVGSSPPGSQRNVPVVPGINRGGAPPVM